MCPGHMGSDAQAGATFCGRYGTATSGVDEAEAAAGTAEL